MSRRRWPRCTCPPSSSRAHGMWSYHRRWPPPRRRHRRGRARDGGPDRPLRSADAPQAVAGAVRRVEAQAPERPGWRRGRGCHARSGWQAGGPMAIDFTFPPEVEDARQRMRAFVDEDIIPTEKRLLAEAGGRADWRAELDRLRERAPSSSCGCRTCRGTGAEPATVRRRWPPCRPRRPRPGGGRTSSTATPPMRATCTRCCTSAPTTRNSGTCSRCAKGACGRVSP